MKTIDVRQPINLKVVKFELDFITPTLQNTKVRKKHRKLNVPEINSSRKQSVVPPAPVIKNLPRKPNVQELIDGLLEELYSDNREWCSSSDKYYGQGSISAASLISSQSTCGEHTDAIERSYLEALDESELLDQVAELTRRLCLTGERLARCVRSKDRLRRQQKRLCAAFSVLLRHIRQMSAILNSLRNLAGPSRASSAGDSGARFSVTPGGGDGSEGGGYTEWLHAMRLVARLPAGVPNHFRKKLWLTLAERYLNGRGIDWPAAERACFRGTAQPDDAELGAQILKDLHRTGCSLFCGTEGRENQAMLRRVLLAYARWNKEVGYCQGFNMLAAIILEVMDKSEADSLKVMIYLVEAVLPEGYFADDLRGLSADMAAFRDLLRLRLPKLANHMVHLQRISDGGGVEPPLPDVFTMQWFLTLYATWLPRESLLRIWDLVLLDGNEVLLLTALAIWDMLQDRIMSARSADEYYSCMGGGAGAVWEAGERLVARVVTLDSAPELPRLRDLHRYRVTPPAPAAPTAPTVYHPPLHAAMQTMTKKGLRLFYSEDEGDSSDEGNKMALATVTPRRNERLGAGDRLTLDIGALKRQYARLRERQRQAHVILAAACARHAAVGVSTSPTSLTVNNLLLGKSAIVSSRGRRLGPPPGAVPPSRNNSQVKAESRTSSRSNETINWTDEKNKKYLSRRNSLKWKDVKKEKKSSDPCRKASIDIDEVGDGIIVSEREANEMIATMRSRSSSETSSYSSHSSSSTDTSLCDDKASDSETDLPLNEGKKHKSSNIKEQNVISDDVKITSSHDVTCTDQHDSHPITNYATLTNITEYIESAAGQPLRTYIDEFQNKCTDLPNNSELLTYKSPSPMFLKIIKSQEDITNNTSKISSKENISKLNSPLIDNLTKDTTIPSSQSSSNMTELNPKEITTCGIDSSHEMYENYSYDPNLVPVSLVTRPADIIDSLSSYPNFVPDIDLSEKPTLLEYDSPLRSPGADSIVVSEDEPPIPLNIDKYFEHSPEFFGARITVTDPNNPDIPNRRATKRLSRTPKKPDSLTLYTSYNEKILHKIDIERASSLPQNHNYFKNTLKAEEKCASPLTTKSRNVKECQERLSETTSINLEIDYKRNLGSQESLNLSQRLSETTSTNLEIDYKRNFGSQESLKCLLSNSDLEKQDVNVKEYDLKEVPDTDVKNYFRSDYDDNNSPKTLRSGRKNSEKALQIIQENSKILSRILTKQNLCESNKVAATSKEDTYFSKLKEETKLYSQADSKKYYESDIPESPILKESTSDSLIEYYQIKNKENLQSDKNDFLRNRPISLDDPVSLVMEKMGTKSIDAKVKGMKSPSADSLVIKTDRYGWENKGFLAKCEYHTFLKKSDEKLSYKFETKTDLLSHEHSLVAGDTKTQSTTDWSKSKNDAIDSKTSVNVPSFEPKDTSNYEHRFASGDYNYPLSSTTMYNDFVLSTASDICSKSVDLGPKVCENTSKTDNSQVSDFAHIVTSSISFTYEPSVDDDSPTGAKSNSSDTLCQITSLDQVSTPISPKIFPNKDTPTLPKEFIDRSDRVKLESDDTCSAITSLIETDTLSSLSYPRSPSTGSYHPFPTRPVMRMPKELGVRLGMYPKDSIHSPTK